MTWRRKCAKTRDAKSQGWYMYEMEETSAEIAKELGAALQKAHESGNPLRLSLLYYNNPTSYTCRTVSKGPT